MNSCRSRFLSWIKSTVIICFAYLLEDGIKFKDMNAEHLIKRLALRETMPSVIWTQIHKYYGDDFFIDMIEEEYGISPHSHEKLQQQMLEIIQKYQE